MITCEPSSPSYSHLGPVHESHLKFEQELDIEVKKIIEGAKALKKEDLEKIYDEKIFSPKQTAD